MYINTKHLVKYEKESMPLLYDEQVITYICKEIKAYGPIYKKKIQSGKYIYVQDNMCEKVRELLERIPNADVSIVIRKSMLPDEELAIENSKTKDITVIKYTQWKQIRTTNTNPTMPIRKKKEKNDDNENKQIEILAEIATMLHTLCLKTDNLTRNIIKLYEKEDK